MAAKVFISDEESYQLWLQDNPDGYVLTTVRKISPSYMSLHRATCRMISNYMNNMAPDAFTGKGYIKICSSSVNDLLAWITEHGGVGFTKRCSRCDPPTDGATEELERLNREVSRSLTDSKNRIIRLKDAPEYPETFLTTITLFRRNPDVIAETLLRANGKCEKCGNPAPFKRAANGTPYLEVHHCYPLGEEGKDTVDNAIALCPNCHRQAHFG